MAYVPSDPVKAREISDYTKRALEQIRSCDTRKALDAQWDGYAAYAKSMGVAPQICEHVEGAINDVAITIKARENADKAAKGKNIANRIIGEHEHEH